MEIIAHPTRPQWEILNSSSQVNGFIAGQGSGKTQCAGWVSANLIISYPDLHGFIGANTYSQLTDSTLFRIRKVWETFFNWTEWSRQNPSGNYVIDIIPPQHFNTASHQYDNYYGKICFENGTVIYKGSLDNYKAHDGKEFAWAILDETKDTKEEAVKEVILGRLREKGMERNNVPWNPLFIFTSPAKTQWLNEWFELDQYAIEIKETVYSKIDFFHKTIDNKLIVISSAYHNAINLPANYLENQKKNLSAALQDTLIYGNPFSQTGGEFYKCFNREKQVRACKWNEALPLHITFDFNVHPYMTCLVHQLEDKVDYQIDEICLSNPLNTTTAICREFKRRYPPGRVSGLFIYGDPAGRHEDTRVEKREEVAYNDYHIIEKELSEYRPKRRVSDSAPPVVPRKDFLNTVFETTFAGIELYINENCKKTIADYTYLKEASDGRKLKEKDKDEQTGIPFEKYGHTSDANDYYYIRVFATEFANFQRGGKGIPKPLYQTKKRAY